MKFAVEDFGRSPLADRFGVDKYPAIFVDEALVARPEDFYAWKGYEKGKYIPWKQPDNRRKFQNDLRRMLDIRLAGGEVASLTRLRTAGAADGLLPDIALLDLDNREFRLRELRGKPVLVEFWATWCPPCLETMSWMQKLEGKAHIAAIAVESEKSDVEKVVARMKPPGRVVMSTTATVAAFGELAAVPTLYLADRSGKIVRVFYGAPPDLHSEIEKELARLE